MCLCPIEQSITQTYKPQFPIILMLGVYPEPAPVLSPSTMFRINSVEGLKGNPQFMLRHSKQRKYLEKGLVK